MESTKYNIGGERPSRYLREKPEAVARQNEEDNTIVEALRQDGSDAAMDFLDYWQEVNKMWNDAVEFVKLVMSGDKIISNEVVEECQGAYLQLSQILHVLLEMKEAPSVSRATKAMMMTVSRRAYEDRIEIKKSIETMSQWQREAGIIITG